MYVRELSELRPSVDEPLLDDFVGLHTYTVSLLPAPLTKKKVRNKERQRRTWNTARRIPGSMSEVPDHT